MVAYQVSKLLKALKENKGKKLFVKEKRSDEKYEAHDLDTSMDCENMVEINAIHPHGESDLTPMSVNSLIEKLDAYEKEHEQDAYMYVWYDGDRGNVYDFHAHDDFVIIETE